MPVDGLNLKWAKRMAQRAICWAVALALVAGCGESIPPTPQQLVNMGRFDEAIQTSTQSLRANPRDAEAYLYRGRAYHCRNAEGDLARAVDDFTASIGISPKGSEAYYSRAIAYRDQGLADKSAADVRLARQFDTRLQEIYSEIPAVTLPTTTDREKTSEVAEETPSAEDASEGEAEIGTRSQAERRRAQKNAANAAARPEIAPFDVKAPAPTKTKAQILESVRKQESGLSSIWEDDFLSDDALLDKQTTPPGKTGAGSRARTGERSRVDSERFPDGPSSPFQPRGPGMAAPGLQSPSQRPLQSPFPQRSPRPTGFVDEQPLGTQRAPSRTLYNNPYSVPTVRPPGAYHDDFNP
jgi:hypothetical protein